MLGPDLSEPRLPMPRLRSFPCGLSSHPRTFELREKRFASDIFGHLRTFELRELWRQVLERFQACDVASGVFKYVQVQPRPNSLLGSACATQARERWSPLLPHRWGAAVIC